MDPNSNHQNYPNAELAAACHTFIHYIGEHANNFDGSQRVKINDNTLVFHGGGEEGNEC